MIERRVRDSLYTGMRTESFSIDVKAIDIDPSSLESKMLVQTGSSCESSWTMTDPSLDLAASGRPWWRKDERIAIVAAVLTATLFFIAGRWGDSVNPDTEAVAIPAWHLVHEGSLDLSTIDEIRENL